MRVLALVGLAACLMLPWYRSDAAWWLPLDPAGSALALGLADRPWLLPVPTALAAAALVALLARAGAVWAVRLLVGLGLGGFAWLVLQSFAIGLRGWNATPLTAAFGAPGPSQAGMGVGAVIAAATLLLIGCRGLARCGWCRGDAFVTSAIGTVVMLITLFVLWPVGTVLRHAVAGPDGGLALGTFADKVFDRGIWGLGCLFGGAACGVAWNTLSLAVAVAVASTALGLGFALITVRTQVRLKPLLRVMTVLPIITPPFVIGLALILMFGRAGAVSGFLFRNLGIPPSRWIYGFSGIAIAQCLAFTPVAYLVLVGVVQGASPSLEEAARMLRARSWTVFRTITWPLMRPGIAAAFLVVFIESMADFGNPLVLGGNFEVLSTKIFFAVVGASTDPARAAILSLVLLAFTLAVFGLQQAWIGSRRYTTVTGKGDAGIALPLPRRVAFACCAAAIPWGLFTFAVYGLILAGGFVRAIGRDYTPTLAHYATAFRIEAGPRGPVLTGSAWPSIRATIEVALVSAPLTAAVGLLIAYLISRQRFAGRRTFEFLTMLSFAIPGTVIGIAYVTAFNVPPIEMTGGALILIVCFTFRNMPVGVRSGMATLAQLDPSLDEASLTLGARSATTLRRITAPLLRPAITATLIYSFVRAMTSISAVVFLVSADYNMATTYIIGRVDAGEYGVAIAYASALIVFMLMVILVFNLLVGERRLGRRQAAKRAAHEPMPLALGPAR